MAEDLGFVFGLPSRTGTFQDRSVRMRVFREEREPTV